MKVLDTIWAMGDTELFAQYKFTTPLCVQEEGGGKTILGRSRIAIGKREEGLDTEVCMHRPGRGTMGGSWREHIMTSGRILGVPPQKEALLGVDQGRMEDVDKNVSCIKSGYRHFECGTRSIPGRSIFGEMPCGRNFSPSNQKWKAKRAKIGSLGMARIDPATVSSTFSTQHKTRYLGEFYIYPYLSRLKPPLMATYSNLEYEHHTYSDIVTA